MKRDLDLARLILQKLEETENPAGPGVFDIEGHGEPTLSYHIKLLAQAGLITALDLSDSEDFVWMPISLTWDGHEFLEASREPGQWANAVSRVKEKTGGLSFEVLEGLLVQIARSAVLGG